MAAARWRGSCCRLSFLRVVAPEVISLRAMESEFLDAVKWSAVWPALSGVVTQQLFHVAVLLYVLVMFTSAPLASNKANISSLSFRLAAIMSGVHPMPSYTLST